MNRLFPAGQDVTIDPGTAVAAEVREPLADRPWLYTNMIASADGGTAVAGLSGKLGGPGDKAMFGALRAVADVILVGASTAREERYRAPIQRDAVAAVRTERGQAAHPRLALVSRSLNLDLELPLFSDADHRPLILTAASAPEEARRALDGRAEVITVGDDGVDLNRALSELHSRGARTVLSEGGPSINGQLVANGLVDEWNLSISPSLLGADSRRAAVGPLPAGPPNDMTLSRVWADDDFLFCRWVARR